MKAIVKTLFLILIPVSLSGQISPVTSQYVLNPLMINPAYAGNRGAMNVAAFYRQQWAGIGGAPETFTFLIDAPLLNNKIGLGFELVSDKIGVTKDKQFKTDYSYKIDLQKGILSFGLGAGLITTNTAWNDLVVLDPDDQLYLADSRVFVVPDFSFGSYYTYNNYFAGFSIPKFLSYKFDYVKNKYSISIDPNLYNYMFSTGYSYTLSSKVKLLPSTLLIYTPGSKLLFDINAYVNFLDHFWVGGSYRNGRSFSGLFQFQVNNQLKIAYTYDFDFGQIRTYTFGSHEIMLRYEFRYKVNVVNPLTF
jgi:type IX secretion system PorP/SprF family membrane protein